MCQVLYKVYRALRAIVLSIPIFLVLFIISVDWYSFVVEFAYRREHQRPALTWFLALLFTGDVALLLASYGRCVLTSSAVTDNPPPPFYIGIGRYIWPSLVSRICHGDGEILVAFFTVSSGKTASCANKVATHTRNMY